MAKEIKTIGAKIVFAWIFSVLFIIGGIGMLFSSLMSGILTLLAGIIILPPFSKMLKEKANLEITTWLKVIIVLVLLMIAGMALPSEDSEDSQDYDQEDNINLIDNSNSQDKLPSASKSWHYVASFSGKGNQDTESFYIKGGKVKITATTWGGYSGIGTYSGIDLESEEGGYLGAGLSISTEGSEEGQGETIYRNLDSGKYYISVITGVNWEVEVEEYY